MGLHLSGVFALVAPSEFWTNLLVRVVTSATSLELVATKASLLIVIAAIAAVSCVSMTFSIVRGCGWIVEVIFKTILVDKVVYCGALWGHSLA